MEEHSANGANGFKQDRQKRERIGRIKKIILWSRRIWMLLTVIICVLLMVRVYLIEEKLDYLLDNFTVSGSVGTDEKQTTPQAGESAYFDLEGVADTEYADEDGLIAQAVNQKENLAKEGDVHKVYLTFDDGPSKNTSQILDILKKHGVKATFFVIGKEDAESKELYRRIVDEGHTLGMHSFSHKYSQLYHSMESFKEDFTRLENYLYEVTGKECLFYRFPGGSSNHVSSVDMKELISFLNGQGMTYFDWNVSSGDATSQAYTPEELVENVVSDVAGYKTSVVLMHDSETKASTVHALEPMIEALKGMGAKLLPIEEGTTVVQHIAASSVN